jgi:uncharacterized membrane protein
VVRVSSALSLLTSQFDEALWLIAAPPTRLVCLLVLSTSCLALCFDVAAYPLLYSNVLGFQIWQLTPLYADIEMRVLMAVAEVGFLRLTGSSWLRPVVLRILDETLSQP